MGVNGSFFLFEPVEVVPVIRKDFEEAARKIAVFRAGQVFAAGTVLHRRTEVESGAAPDFSAVFAVESLVVAGEGVFVDALFQGCRNVSLFGGG
jgi:hypothetical protein